MTIASQYFPNGPSAGQLVVLRHAARLLQDASLFADLGTNVVSGMAPTVSGTGIVVASGHVAVGGIDSASAGDTLVPDLTSSRPRIDVAVSASDGTLSLVVGAPADFPTPPALKAGQVPIAAIYVPVGASALDPANLVDLRLVGAIGSSDVEDAATIYGLARPITTKTADWTLALADAGAVVRMNKASAITLTVPANATVAFAIGTEIVVAQIGAGKLTVAAAGGVTVSGALGFRKQLSFAILRKTATNTWEVTGDTVAAATYAAPAVTNDALVAVTYGAPAVTNDALVAVTAAAVVTTASGLASYGYAQAQADAIPVAINACEADIVEARAVIAELQTDLAATNASLAQAAADMVEARAVIAELQVDLTATNAAIAALAVDNLA